MKKVIILISTYQGEKYIGAQLDSIIAQIYQNWELYIRDDGSKDCTQDILEAYAKKDQRIHVVPSNHNLGYPACFYTLTNMSLKADYYMFGDQDDIWLPEKIARAVEMLDAQDQHKPLAYYASYHICDGDMKVQSQSPDKTNKIQFKDTLFNVCGLEFTMAVNETAMQLIRKFQPKKSNARGTWMSMLLSAYGEIMYDNRPCAMYRRHSEAVTNNNMNFIGTWIWRMKNFFGGGFDEYKIILSDFHEVMHDDLEHEQVKLLELFNSKHMVKKLCYPHRLRDSIIDELGLRFVFLIRQL